RLPEPVVPVQPLGEELRDGGGEQATSGDVREVTGAAVLEGVARGLERVVEETSEVAIARLGWRRLELRRDLQRVAGVLRRSGGESADPVDDRGEDDLAHRAHLVGGRLEGEAPHRHASSRATASSSSCDAAATSSTA